MIGAKRLVVAASVFAMLVTTTDDVAVAAGAYAFGQKPGPTGWSGGSAFNYNSQTEAQNQALAHCRSRKEAADYCKIIANVNGKCFAIAVQDGGNGYGWNTATTEQEAQHLAMDRCSGYGKTCAIHQSFCDTKTPTSSAAPPQATPAPTPRLVEPTSTSPGGGGSPACQKFPDLC